jgi:hypothetical protein
MSCTPVTVPVPQVTRIPILGPKPFNTLVCCSFGGEGSTPIGSIGRVGRGPETAISSFVLQGFDQRTPPQFEHSTTGWLAIIGPCQRATWLYAIDAIDSAAFTPTGVFTVTVNVAAMPAQAPVQYEGGVEFAYGWAVWICSYVLVYEPPPTYPAGNQMRLVPAKLRLVSPPSDIPLDAGEEVSASKVAAQYQIASGTRFGPSLRIKSPIFHPSQISPKD